MTVEERRRRELQEALVDSIGSEPTDTLFGYLPPVGWADVATTRDVQALGAELRGEMDRRFGVVDRQFGELRGEFGELRGEFGELRGEFGELRGELRAEMHRLIKVQLYWTTSLMLAALALVVALLTTGVIG